MTQKIPNPPLYYVVGQIKFAPILAMDEYIKQIQNLLRQKGFIHFETHEASQLTFSTSQKNETPPEPKVIRATTWLFSDAQRASGYILTNSSIVFHTTEYETHDEFIAALLLGFGIAKEAANISGLERIGIRYLNAIWPNSNEAVDDYLPSNIHGFNFGNDRKYALSEAVFETNVQPLIQQGVLRLRVLQMQSIFGYPPDLIPIGLNPQNKFNIDASRPHGLIDIDHFVEGEMIINIDNIKSQLISLHKEIHEIFESVTTDHAKISWNTSK